VTSIRRYLAVVVFVVGVSSAAGQDRLPIGTRVGSAVEGSSGEPDDASMTYDQAGRRDPFVSPVAAKTVVPPVAPQAPRRAHGLRGVTLADVSVKGIVRNRGVALAVLAVPGGKSFVARSLDRLADATIKAIELDGVVFAQETQDVAGAVATRDVRKSLPRATREEDR
jgi:hypothetical protein